MNRLKTNMRQPPGANTGKNLDHITSFLHDNLTRLYKPSVDLSGEMDLKIIAFRVNFWPENDKPCPEIESLKTVNWKSIL